ncbi:MAG: PKD domain-containing protein, partial [Novosphingobium sp.]
MRSTLRKSIKISLLAGSGLVGAAASQPAQAATLNGAISFPSAQSVPGTTICFIQTSFSITGTQDDNGAGSDQIYLQSFSPTTGNGSGSNIFFANGSTVTLTRNVQFNAGFHPREPHFAKLYDLIGPAGPGQGITQIGQGQIPRAILIAAGGNCAAIAENVAPTNTAGPDQSLASGGGTVTLAGAASDGDGDLLTHSWTQISGPVVTLSGANTLSPTFTAPIQTNQPRTMVFRLTTTDNIGNPVTDDVTVTLAAGPNTLPTANAGADATVTPGASQALTGGATDIDGDPLTYQWTQVSGPTVTITNPASANASFVAPAANGALQTLTFELVANDGFGNSAPDQVTFTVPANTTPIANAGADQSVYGLSAVALDGTGSSDGDGDPLTYSWVQTGGPTVALSSSTAARPTFTAPAGTGTAQNLTFDLVVSDGIASSVADSVTVTVAANRVPVANAGADLGPIDTGSTITLNGGGSTDPDGDPLTFAWTQISGPAVTLSNPATANPSFVAPAVTGGTQDIVFQLVVSDGQVSSAPDEVRVTVRSVGSITIVQRVVGSDGTFTYSSNVSALAGSITTTNGIGQRQATLVPAGSYSFSVADARAAGYVVT